MNKDLHAYFLPFWSLMLLRLYGEKADAKKTKTDQTKPHGQEERFTSMYKKRESLAKAFTVAFFIQQWFTQKNGFTTIDYLSFLWYGAKNKLHRLFLLVIPFLCILFIFQFFIYKKMYMKTLQWLSYRGPYQVTFKWKAAKREQRFQEVSFNPRFIF